MSVDRNLLSEFAKITNDTQANTQTQLYGTVVTQGDKKYVKMDGSDIITPIISTTDIKDGERVMVSINNHIATVTGNITNPSAGNDRVSYTEGKVDEFDYLFAGNITAENIAANSITADKLLAGSITTDKLMAESIIADKIAADAIESKHIKADAIESKHIKADAIEAEHIKAGAITADKIDAGIITSDHIASGTITADDIATGTITAGSGIIAEGAIGSAQISSLDVAKLESGTIDTSKIYIAGADGHLQLKGNRLQVFDGLGNRAVERVSLGDVNGDGSKFGLRVRGSDGETILLDENGVTSEGITDGSITNNKISDDANIDGAKLNINSVVSKINEDGTETIQGTKIEVDGTTLNTKLSTITNKQTEDGERITQAQSQISANTNAIKLKVDEQTYTTDKKDMTSKLEKNTSEILTMKGQIALKVEQTDIENAKSELEGIIDSKINTAKADIKITTDAISQNVSNLSQTVSNKADGSTVSSLNSKVSSLETSVNGISGKVTSLEKTTTTLGTQVNTANTNASSALNKANNATTTANNAQNTANTNKSNITDLQGEVSTVKNNVASLEVTTSGISQKVSSVESTTATLSGKVNTAQNTANSAQSTANSANSKIDNLNISDRNLVKNSDTFITTGNNTNKCTMSDDFSQLFNNNKGKKLSISIEVNATNALSTNTSGSKRLGCELTVTYSDDTKGYFGVWQSLTNNALNLNKKRVNNTYTIPNKDIKSVSTCGLYIQGLTSGTVKIGKPKYQISDKSSDWTPAPEDIDNAINTVDGKLTTLQGEYNTTKSQVATLETNLDGITQRVSSTESTTATLTTKVTNAQNTANQAKTDANNANNNATNALNKANSANTLAGSKAKVFTSTPTVPYKVGDLWVQGTNGDVMKCKTARASGSYTASDWEKASKYTDDTKANAVDGKVTTLQGTVNTTKSKVATLETNLNGITQRVSSTESTTANLTGTVNNLKSPSAMPYQKDLIIYGESNKYYPVYIRGGNQDVLRTIKIWRAYSEQAPSDWYNSTHKGSLMFTWQGNFGGWGGASYKEYILENSSEYTTLLADCKISVHSMGYTFFLRGGGTTGAVYHFGSDQTINPEVYYNGASDKVYDNANDKYDVYAFEPLTTVNTTRLNNMKIARESSVSAVNSKVSTIETNLNGITSRVSTAENKITTTDNKVSGIDSRLATAESKITETAITNTVKKNFYTKSETNSQITSKGYQTASQVQQTVNGLELKFNESGGYNLLYNSSFKNGFSSWGNNGGTVSIISETSSPTGNSVKVVAGGSGRGIYQHYTPKKTGYYTVSFYGKADANLSFYFGQEGSTTKTVTLTTSWQKFTYTFNRTTLNRNAYVFYPQSAGTFYIHSVLVEEGQLSSNWSPHPSEVYDGITKIDKDGITVQNSNSSTYTQIDSSSFRVENNTGGTVAEFSQNSQIPNLTAGIINANAIYSPNICTKSPMSGSIKYIVNGSTGNDNNNGTTYSTPFKTVAKAVSMLNTQQDRSVDIEIYGSVSGWDVKGINGTGRIGFYFSSDAIINGEVIVGGVNNTIGFYGGSDDKATFKNGISVYRSRDVEFTSLTFRGTNSKGSNIYLEDVTFARIGSCDLGGLSTQLLCAIEAIRSNLWIFNCRGSKITDVVAQSAFSIAYAPRSGTSNVPDYSNAFLCNYDGDARIHNWSGGNFVKTPSKGWNPAYTPTQKTQTWSFNKIWSDETLKGWSDRQELIQGYASTWNTGRWTGYMQMVDDFSEIRNAISGGTNLSGRIYVQRTSSSGNSTGSKLCLYGSDGTLITNSTSINRGQGVWVSLSSSIIQKIQSGAIKYFYLKADANNASTYFKCERNCKIEITYTK